MSESHWVRKHWKVAVNVITVAALAGLVVALHSQIIDTFRQIGQVKWWILLLIIPIELLNYDAQAKIYKKLFAIVGTKVSYKHMYKLSLELNFVNHVFPSGGVSGISYFGVRMRNNHVTGARAALVQLMKLVLLFVSFEVLILLGVLIMAVDGGVSGLVILLAGSITTMLVLGTCGFVYIIGSARRIDTFFVFMTRALNRLIHVVRPQHPETINIARARKVFSDLHENYLLFQSKLPELRKPFLYALVANVTEVAAVYVVYLAFDEVVNLGAVILAYAVANFAGLISVLPGGVGVYEALMTGVLAIAGIPVALSIPVTVMYRVLSMLVQVPPGYYLYHRALSRGDDELVKTDD
jgi:uncharacterized protein (TIRG00374 family)